MAQELLRMYALPNVFSIVQRVRCKTFSKRFSKQPSLKHRGKIYAFLSLNCLWNCKNCQWEIYYNSDKTNTLYFDIQRTVHRDIFL